MNNSKILEIDENIEDTALVLAKNKANVGISIRLNFVVRMKIELLQLMAKKAP